MRIAHVAIWTARLEELREFYCKYFEGESGHKYVNTAKGFESYFVCFDDGARLELMRRADVVEPADTDYMRRGLCHIAFGFNERDEVVSLTERLRVDGHRIVGEPRITGDGMFESVVCDPDGNLVEIVAE